MRINTYYKVLRKWFRKEKKHKRWVKNSKLPLFRLRQTRWGFMVKATVYTLATRWGRERYRIVNKHQKYHQSIKTNRYGLLHRQTANQGIQGSSIDLAKRRVVTNRFSPQGKIKKFNQGDPLLNQLGLSCSVPPLSRVNSCYIYKQLLQTGLLIFIKPFGFSKVSGVESSGIVFSGYGVMIGARSLMGNNPKSTVVSEFVMWSKNKNEGVSALEFFGGPGAAVTIQKTNEEGCSGSDDDDSNGEGFPDWVGKVRTDYISSSFGAHPSACYCYCKDLCGGLKRIEFRWGSRVRNLDCTEIDAHQEVFQGIQEELIEFLERGGHNTDFKRIVNDKNNRLNEKISCFKENINQENKKIMLIILKK